MSMLIKFLVAAVGAGTPLLFGTEVWWPLVHASDLWQDIIRIIF